MFWLKSPLYGYGRVNERCETPVGLPATTDMPAAEWMVATDPVPYRRALTVMDERVAAIAAGDAPELVWLLKHPPLYTAGTRAAAASSPITGRASGWPM
jgi:lipoyl(octanoyl) transferase